MELQSGILIGLIGILAGFLSGMLGLGGAIIIIPALVLLGYTQQMAQGTTLLMLVMPVGALAAWQYYKGGNVDITASLILAAAFFVSGYFGAKFAMYIPQEMLRKIFAIVLVLIAIKTWFFNTHIS